MIHLPQIFLNFLAFFTVWVARKFCGEKGSLEIVKGFLNKRLWMHWPDGLSPKEPNDT